jgi:polyisoprenoid-binding protein YceI
VTAALPLAGPAAPAVVVPAAAPVAVADALAVQAAAGPAVAGIAAFDPATNHMEFKSNTAGLCQIKVLKGSTSSPSKVTSTYKYKIV